MLVGTRRPPVERFVALSSVLDQVWIGERRAELASFRFASAVGGVTHPCGISHLVRFEAREAVKWEFDLGGGAVVERVLVGWRRY